MLRNAATTVENAPVQCVPPRCVSRPGEVVPAVSGALWRPLSPLQGTSLHTASIAHAFRALPPVPRGPGRQLPFRWRRSSNSTWTKIIVIIVGLVDMTKYIQSKMFKMKLYAALYCKQGQTSITTMSSVANMVTFLAKLLFLLESFLLFWRPT